MKKQKVLIYALSGALAILALGLLVGTAYARYRAQKDLEIRLQYEALSQEIHLLAQETDAQGSPLGLPMLNEKDSAGKTYKAPGNWSVTRSTESGTPEEYVLHFLLSNTDAKALSSGESRQDPVAQAPVRAYLEVFVTEGAAENGALTLELTVNGQKYTGVSREAQAGDAYLKAYGKGRIFRFPEADGTAFTVLLPGGTETHVPMTLTVKGAAEAPAGVYLIAAGTAE